MKTRRLLGHGLRSMGRQKARTALMMLGTFIGVAALTVVIAIGRGAERQMLERMNILFSGRSILLFSSGGGMGGPRPGGQARPLTLADLEAIQDAVPAVTLADPTLLIRAREVSYEGDSRELLIFGHSQNAEAVWGRGVSRGRFFTAADVESSARVALAGERVVEDLLGGADPIGARIRVGSVPFEVVGVLEPVGTDPHGLDRDNEIHIPISTAMRRVANVNFIGSAKLLVSPEDDLDAAVFAVEDVMRERHTLTPDEPNDFHMVTPVQVQEMVRSSNRVFTVFLPLLAGLSILVGGIVLANLMLMSVNERRAEIGLRKAVGARTRDIWGQFLVECCVITGLAGVLALGAGTVVIRVLRVALETPAAMSPGVASLGLVASVAVGLVAGVVPARRAARLEAVASLR